MKLENFFQHMQLTRVQFTAFYKEVVFFFYNLIRKKSQFKTLVEEKAAEQDFLRGIPHVQEAYVKNAQYHQKL